MTEYPSSIDYVEAVCAPEQAFDRPDLQRAEFPVHPVRRVPWPASGSAAVVFQARVGGRNQALRFFIQEDVSEERRYTALDRHFVTKGMQNWVARTTWVDDAIAVNGRRWPMVQMEWVDGQTLDTHIRAVVGRRDPAALVGLATGLRERVGQLQSADFAHGDLQHGNVLVEPSGALRLVDFDGSWIPAFDRLSPPNEQGHPNYQHGHRRWGRRMDTFPALVIYTGLLALSRKPDAWRNDECILFTHDDLRSPGATETWKLVEAIPDRAVGHAVERLRAACRSQRQPDIALESLLGPEQVTVPPRPATRAQPPDFVLSGKHDDQWYEDDEPTTPTGRTYAAPEATFTGVSGRVSADPPPADEPPTTVAPEPQKPSKEEEKAEKSASLATVLLAGGIAPTLGLMVGGAVGKGAGPALGVITAIVVFSVALPLLRRTR